MRFNDTSDRSFRALLGNIAKNAADLSSAFDGGRAFGGAIHAAADVLMISSIVTNGVAESTFAGVGGRGGSQAIGGGVSASGGVVMIDSMVIGSGAYSAAGIGAGGGIAAAGGISSKYSIIAGNAAAVGGAQYVAGSIGINTTTIASNTSLLGGAGLLVGDAGSVTTVRNSTIVGNLSETKYNLVIGPDATISSSTIARNTCFTDECISAGVHLAGGGALELQSSLVADNAVGAAGIPLDVSGADPALVVSGANNLVTAASVTLPPDTLQSPPRLTGLRFAGGPTPVMTLRGTSPALNAGNNVAGLDYDQRGTGFPRVSGPQADIGAFEMDFSEYLFADDFGQP